MNLYEYKKEDNVWSRVKVKTLEPGTPEYKFYERFEFIENKWFNSSENVQKILEKEYKWLGDFENKPVYNECINDLEEIKRQKMINKILNETKCTLETVKDLSQEELKEIILKCA